MKPCKTYLAFSVTKDGFRVMYLKAMTFQGCVSFIRVRLNGSFKTQIITQTLLDQLCRSPLFNYSFSYFSVLEIKTREKSWCTTENIHMDYSL